MAISPYYGLLPSLSGFNSGIVNVHIYKQKETRKLSLMVFFPSDLIWGFHLQKANYEENIMMTFFTDTFLKNQGFFFSKMNRFDQKAIVTVQKSAYSCTGFG